MDQISIQDLKANLSKAVAEAESGKTIVITRHNEPVATLNPARSAHLHVGRQRPGRKPLRPAIRNGTRGRYLALLAEDRSNR
jgi:prevent-host-death family protein